MFGYWKQMTFGVYLQDLFNFVYDNGSILGIILFGYVIVVFIGRYGGMKYIPDKFEQFVILKSKELLDKKELNSNELVNQVYEGWKKELTSFPSYVYIKSKKDYWIERPTIPAMEERLDINKNKVVEILEKNGVITIG